ncbi:MAG: phosphoenolpyruvate carboxykinase (ATP) [Candidatus Hydrogenedentota bacterium]|nr:MAG: phosphoenolpyruvate carboxykinase (ATP) [Candidatus Hydrogenedentota bacterium]
MPDWLKPKSVVRLASPAAFIEESLKRSEGHLSDTGALCVLTGRFTGRAPNDRFLVDTNEIHEKVNWGKVNKPISEETYRKVQAEIARHFRGRDLFATDGWAGADREYGLKIRVLSEKASHGLFAWNMFIRPTRSEAAGFEPDWFVVSAPSLTLDLPGAGLNSDIAVLLNFRKRTVLIAGTGYAGEIKKSIFTALNFLLPERDVFPMHCSCNVGADGSTAVFFGLSGTGKTTLSSDPERSLVGDDEHGWGAEGVFNFEGGCYAKCINLSAEDEPQIWNAIRFGALVENVVLDPVSRSIDFSDDSHTANTRVSYPIHYIPGFVPEGRGGHPRTVIFLTADAFGVLPPVMKLDVDRAQYHFLSGYTSKLAGTEVGVTEPVPTFSECFGAPFMPRFPSEYSRLLAKKIEKHGSSVFLINTGWQGGPFGIGKRISISHTRKIVHMALDGTLDKVSYRHHEIFNVDFPKALPGIPEEVLNPEAAWKNKNAYFQKARELAAHFRENFQRFPKASALAEFGPKA